MENFIEEFLNLSSTGLYLFVTSSDLTWGPKEDDNYSAIVESTVGLVHLLFKTGGWIGAFLRLGKASGFSVC